MKNRSNHRNFYSNRDSFSNRSYCDSNSNRDSYSKRSHSSNGSNCNSNNRVSQNLTSVNFSVKEAITENEHLSKFPISKFGIKSYMDFVGLNSTPVSSVVLHQVVSQDSKEECDDDDDDIPRTKEDAECDPDSIFYDPVDAAERVRVNKKESEKEIVKVDLSMNEKDMVKDIILDDFIVPWDFSLVMEESVIVTNVSNIMKLKLKCVEDVFSPFLKLFVDVNPFHLDVFVKEKEVELVKDVVLEKTEEMKKEDVLEMMDEIVKKKEKDEMEVVIFDMKKEKIVPKCDKEDRNEKTVEKYEVVEEKFIGVFDFEIAFKPFKFSFGDLLSFMFFIYLCCPFLECVVDYLFFVVVHSVCCLSLGCFVFDDGG